MSGAALALFRREVRLAVRVGGGAMMGAVFFLTVVVIMPFAVGPDLNLLQRVGPAILWVGALLASLIGLDRLFQADHEDGSLDLMTMTETPLVVIVAVKAAAHWVTTGLPLVIVAPVLGLMLNVEPGALVAVALTLLVGTPGLTFVGAIGAALTVALRRGGLLVPVLVLPLTVPILIFGVSATGAAIAGPMSISTPLAVLGSLTLLSLVLAPLAAAAALRLALE
ncbi:heme exporter protein CcmB [Microbaculum marinum]|uniref:Heme exporter protein B n=1 Tax=Microbaculum marinum TaxID=1764581 RepID=A0AAW9RM12_9HYPH